jgi:hypothetical protein
VAAYRGIGDSHQLRLDRATPVAGLREERRRPTWSGRLGVGSLACNRCDAPVALGPGPVSPAHAITCPFCNHSATVRNFLSLAVPTRPARVEVRVRIVGV